MCDKEFVRGQWGGEMWGLNIDEGEVVSEVRLIFGRLAPANVPN